MSTDNLGTLYSRNVDGSVQTWTIEVSGNKYRVVSGRENGQLVVSEWTVCSGKNVGKSNETSPEQQALCEAEARREKKLKSRGYFENRQDIDNKLHFVEPMLAKEFLDRVDKIDWRKGVLVQNKLNGFRCVATFDGSEVQLKSRTGEKYVSVPHVNKDLLAFFKDFPSAVIDGELFNNDLRQKLNEISKLLRKTKHISAEDFARSEQLVQYHVYDGYDMTPELTKSAPYNRRKDWLDNTLPKYSKYYREVPSILAHSRDELDDVFWRYVNDGQEGVIVRIPDSPYENKRSKFLLKYKPEDSAECVVLDVVEGDGNWSGCAKTASICWNDKTFDATFVGTREQCADVLKNREWWKNKEVTFKYFAYTGLGKPNFARIDLNNCFEGPK